jgi:hypothetical protein
MAGFQVTTEGLTVVIRGQGKFAERVKERRLDMNYTVSKREGRMLKHYIG